MTVKMRMMRFRGAGEAEEEEEEHEGGRRRCDEAQEEGEGGHIGRRVVNFTVNDYRARDGPQMEMNDMTCIV